MNIPGKVSIMIVVAQMMLSWMEGNDYSEKDPNKSWRWMLLLS